MRVIIIEQILEKTLKNYNISFFKTFISYETCEHFLLFCFLITEMIFFTNSQFNRNILFLVSLVFRAFGLLGPTDLITYLFFQSFDFDDDIRYLRFNLVEHRSAEEIYIKKWIKYKAYMLQCI